MKNLKYFALVGLAATALTASAQFANGGSKSGASFDNDTQDYSRLYVDFADMFVGNDYASESYLGFKAGYAYGISLTKSVPVYLEFGANVQFNTKESYGYRTNFLAINVPVTVNYKLKFSNGFFIQPYAGLDVKVNLLSNMTYEGESASLDGINTVQFGGTFGSRFGYKNVDLNIGYDVLSNISDYTSGNTFHVGLGFNF